MPSRCHRLTIVVLAGALATGGLTATGCGSGDPGSNGLDVVGRAADATGRQTSYRMRQVVQQHILGKTVSLRGDGVFSDGRGRVSLDLSPLLSAFPEAAASLDRVGGVAALKGELLVEGRTLFVRLPALQRGLKVFANRDEPEWASLDLARVAKLLGIDIGSLAGGNQQVIAYLYGLTGNAQNVGTEQVDGVRTTHYRGTLDLVGLPPGSVPPAMRRTLEQASDLAVRAGGSMQNPLEVWVGDDKLIRREIVSHSLNGTTTTTTINFSDYGKPVQIRLPPAAARYDLLNLVNKLAPGALAAVAQQLKAVR